MINTVSLLNEIKQPEFIRKNESDWTGDKFAFSSMLESSVENNSYNSAPLSANEKSVYEVNHSEENDAAVNEDNLDDVEIELTAEENDDTEASLAEEASRMTAKNGREKYDFGKNNKWSASIAELGSFMKKNIEITDGKYTAANLLVSDMPSKNVKTTKIKVRNLDAAAKSKVTDILKNMKTGKMSEFAGLNAIAAILADSKQTAGIRNEKGSGKNVKVTAKIASQTEKHNINMSMVIPQTRMSKTEQTVSNKSEITEIKETKTVKTTNTEVSRKYDKTKTVKHTEGQANQLNMQEPKELVTEFTLKLEGSDKADNAKDIKTVLSDNRHDIFNKMVENTKIIQSQNMTKFSMVMRPENVGRMDFHLTVKDGKLDGRIILQNSEAADFFRANIEEITAVFRKANVELGKLDVSVAGQQFHSEGQTFAGQSNGGGQSYTRETLDTVRAVSQMTGRAVSAYESNSIPAANAYAGNGRVNLLI